MRPPVRRAIAPETNSQSTEIFSVMKKIRTDRVLIALLVSCIWTGMSTVARAQVDYDRIHLPNGQSVPARIGEITADKVVVQQSGSSKEYPVNEIRFIQFAGEPREMLEVRTAHHDGNYQRMIEALDKIPPAQLGVSERVKQDVDFYRALASAKLAAQGMGDVRAAGQTLVGFINSNKSNYHFYEANEAAGDLLMAINRPEQALTYYQALAKAPWPAMKMHSAVLQGRALQAQNKHDEAVSQFNAALSIEAKGPQAEAEMLAAKVGKASSQVATGNASEGVATLREIIEQAPAENLLIHAIAYNALGNAYLKLQKPKEATHAFLHVDILFNQNAEQHAEALSNLKTLWEQQNQPERAKAAADLLKTRYPNSKWK